jgi:hypothetical protein
VKLDDILSRLEGVEERGEGWVARCPAHDDDNPSLSIGRGRNGAVLLNCFGGCTFEEVMDALEERESGVTSVGTPDNPPMTVDFRVVGKAEDGLRWWAAKTKVPVEVWEALGTEAYGTGVKFLFEGFNAFKYRKPPRPDGSKDVGWAGDVAPPFWPVPPVEPEGTEAWVVEGESDCGTMRYAGAQCFTTTKGSKGVPTVAMFEELATRGITTITIVGDGDSAGEEYMRRAAVNAIAAGMHVKTVELRRLFDPFSGMVDLNDAWKACLEEAGGERASAQRLFLERLESVTESYVTALRVLDGETALDWSDQEVNWLVPDLIAPGDKGIIIAAQKSYKTWICLDLVRSMLMLQPFMRRPEWVPKRPSRIGFVEEEGSKNAFGKRMSTLQIPREVWRDRFRLIHRSGFRFTEPAAVAELIQIVRTHELDVLILDPLQRMIPGLDENSASEMAVVWDAVADLHRAHPDLVVLLVHHAGKGKDAGWDAARGSSRHAGEVDFGIFVQREKERGHLKVRVDGRDIPEYLGTGEYFTTRVEIDMDDDPTKRRFVLDATELEVTVVEKPKDDAPKPPSLAEATAARKRAGVYEAVAGGLETVAELVMQTGLTRTTVQRILGELEKDGVVTKLPASPGMATRYQTTLTERSTT